MRAFLSHLNTHIIAVVLGLMILVGSGLRIYTNYATAPEREPQSPAVAQATEAEPATRSATQARSSADRDFFPVGVYDKYDQLEESRFTDPDWQAYYRRVFTLLQDNHLNTIVSPYVCDPESLVQFVELAAAYDIRVILRTNPEGCIRPHAEHPVHPAFTHPATIALMFGDEPDEEDAELYQRNYAYLEQHYPDKPIVSAMVGENVDQSGGTPAQAWQMLGAQVRLVRFYPFRQDRYDLINWWRPPEGFHVAPDEAFRIIEESNDSAPWWYIVQTFGGPEATRAWSVPTAADITALGHSALAYGARGLLGFSLQDEGPEWSAMTNQDLEPQGERLAAFARLAAHVTAHSAVLLRHERGTFPVRHACHDCLVVPRIDPALDAPYIYVVNQNTREARTATITLPGAAPHQATDIYSGRQYTAEQTDGAAHLTIALQPGEGQFIRLTHAAQEAQ
jgi:hypothetical protein